VRTEENEWNKVARLVQLWCFYLLSAFDYAFVSENQSSTFSLRFLPYHLFNRVVPAYGR